MRWTEQQLASHLERTSVASAPNRVSHRPFAVPDIVLDLPPPISVNRIWRKTKAGMIKSAAYTKWLERADAMLIDMDQLKGVKPLPGKFSAHIVVKRSRLDLDNNSKVVLDFLQSRCFIVNDSLCEELTICWGDAPTGCRVTVRPLLNTIGDVLRRAEERA